VASFVVEALPVVAYDALLVATSWLGEVVDDDAPYRLETHLAPPNSCWCLLELVPDAGASTVSLTVGPVDVPGAAMSSIPDVESIRDLWITNLNRLASQASGEPN
jgi:hypothetical protein